MNTIRGRGERGASLLIILALIALLAIFVSAIGTQGVVGSRSTSAIRNQRTDVFASKNAINAAINYLRGDATRGRYGVPGCGPSMPFTMPSANGNVSVSCTARPTSGLPEGGDNFPAYALLAMDPTIAGIDVSGNNPLGVDGAAWSNSSIQLGTQTILDAGNNVVGSTSGCNRPGNIVSVPTPPLCGNGSSVVDPGDEGDPATGPWASSVQTAPTAQTLPTCADPAHYNAVSHVMRLDPGSYADGPGLSALTTAGCGGPIVLWLPPGGYYFDFGLANTLWTISNAYVIGGTPTSSDPTNVSNWDPLSTTVDQRTLLATSFASRAAAATTTPSSCNRNRAGVELVFGGESHLTIGSPGALELCPTPNASTQQIVLYGRKSGPTVDNTYQPTTVTCSPAALICDTPAPVLQIENTGAANTTGDFTVTKKNTTQTLTFGGYDLTPIPAGSVINSLHLHVGHLEGSNSGTWDISATVKVGATTLCSGVNVPAQTTPGIADIPCTSNFAWNTPQLATVSFAISRNKVSDCDAGNSFCKLTLDGIDVAVNYSPTSSFRPQSGCVTALSGACPFINVDNTGGSNQAAVYVWGTVYTPLGGLTADFKNKSQFLFGRGAVVRWFQGAGIPPQQLFGAFSSGSSFAYANRVVDLVACLPAATPCTPTSPTRKLLATVNFGDHGIAPGATPVVTIERWNALN